VARLPRPCKRVAVPVLARYAGVRAAAVHVRGYVAQNSWPECAYSAGRVTVTVNVDSGAQPYFVLERAAIEAGQKFTVDRLVAPPVTVLNVGLEADWFPVEQSFETTDGVNLIAATVSWPGASQARMQALGQAVARLYLGKLVQPPGFSG